MAKPDESHDALPKSGSCAKCGNKLNVVRYLEENCTFFYEIGCTNGDSEQAVIQVGRPLKPGSICPNCLVGIMGQVPIQDGGVRLACDSCLVVISFGYAVKAISR